MKFHQDDIPVATSMIELAKKADHPFQECFSLWAAFNNLYTLIGQPNDLTVERDVDQRGYQRIERRWGYIFPKVKLPSEHQLISEAIRHLAPEVKGQVIRHANIEYYVSRTPTGVTEEVDTYGKRINGVLNVTRTIDELSPVWSPIDPDAYASFMEGNQEHQEILIKQIASMLYTIRNNLVHGKKSFNEANDVEVVRMAVPILAIIVSSFIRGREIQPDCFERVIAQ